MSDFESIVVVEDWISEHYFTSEGKGTSFQKNVLDLRKEWEAEAKDGHETVLKRFSAARVQLQTEMAQLAEKTDSDLESSARDVYCKLREVLGIVGAPEALAFERGAQDHIIKGLWVGDTKDVLWLEGTPSQGGDALTASKLLAAEGSSNSEVSKFSLAKHVSELYQCDPQPKYIVLSVGSYLFLTERERWPEGRYLSADVQLIADRNGSKKGGEIDRFLAIFSKQSLAPAADGTIWWDTRLDESRQHAVGVSKDLRDGIRESIEIIANDVLQRRTTVGRKNDMVDGQDLARQSLRFLYRILFLLYAEASPELGVLPKGTGEYDNGYGLDRLRELVQVDLTSHQSQVGTHLYDSLNLLFELVNGNHRSQSASKIPNAAVSYDANDELEENQGLRFEALEADLFASEATSLINQTKLGNTELQRVLERLLLSKASSKGDRGFISYANLGINQLGAVYEGLMSYTGFIAHEDLHEVAKNGDASKGSWVVPAERSGAIDSKHFVKKLDEDGIPTAVIHPRGSFVYRLAGRERQQSASYYTPEVLTKFVVSQALEELLTDDIEADDILKLNVCEPALGSGAFAIEAVRQLAESYLKRKQEELQREIPADQYPQELQKVKAQIALHQVHGVDLNSTAVELAEVSLWLDTMQPGLSAPWFGMRLKQGNSLVGARRATYSVEQIKGKKYLSEEPQTNPLSGLAHALDTDGTDPAVFGKVHHFLLPGEGWGAAADAKEVKDLAGEEQKKLKDWAKSTRVMLTKTQISRLQAVSERVELLWKISLRRMNIASAEAHRFIDYWPHEREREYTSVTREEIETTLADPNGAYRRLQRAMNVWNALWYWPLTESEIAPPKLDDWIGGLEGLLGKPLGQDKKVGRKSGLSSDQGSILSGADWDDIKAYEEIDFPLAQMKSISALEEEHPWLAVCDRVSKEQGFFHWELEFAPVFAQGGFDLQVGNPPWVRPRSDEAALLAEHDPWWQLVEKPTQEAIKVRKKATLELPGAKREFINAAIPTPVLAAFLGASTQYKILSGLQPDLYRAFMERTWRSASASGVVSLIHPESHFTEKKAKYLRSAAYKRLRRHWQFTNSLGLFEIHSNKVFSVNVYASSQLLVGFISAASICSPETINRSLKHEGGTKIPGLKTAEGKWDTRPHPERIVNVDLNVLKVWADILDEPGTSPLHARMVYPVNRASMTVLEKLSKAPRVRELGLQYSRGWDESIDRKKGYFEVGSKVNESWDDVILQGPHFTVANPFAKQPNPTMKNNLDWTELDLEALPADFIPRTSYQPKQNGVGIDYDDSYTHWEVGGNSVSARDHYRVCWRLMAPNDSVRAFYPSMLPKRAVHINGVLSASTDVQKMTQMLGVWSSVIVDFLVRLTQVANLTAAVINELPHLEDGPLSEAIVRRTARLNFLTSAYSEIWSNVMPGSWTKCSTVCTAQHRRELQVEIDTLVAIAFGITADELCAIYRTQFFVMQRQETSQLFDAAGRAIPQEIAKSYRKVGEEGMSLQDRQWTHPQSGVEYTFEFPFRSFDREEDMRAAYAKFSKMLAEHGEIIEEGI
ncbi:DNA methyltransferase [Glutamicibacter ardleyensis]|uniref:DNA methyltransferase n=1 Tax=Glutamicibacter ardleyensis TaxID=225894 RepID=UPI003FD2A8B3